MKLEPHNEIVAKPQPLWVNQDMIIPLHCTFSKFISELTPKLQEAFKPSLLVSGAVLWRMCLTKGWSRLCTVNPIATGNPCFPVAYYECLSFRKKKTINLETTIQLSPLLKYHCWYWSLCIQTLPQKGLNKKTVILPNRRHRWIHRSWSFRSILPGKNGYIPNYICIYIYIINL